MGDELLELKANVPKALGQPTQLKILELLRNGERSVCEIFPAIEEKRSDVSRHLALMKATGILGPGSKGRWSTAGFGIPRS